MNNSNLSYLKVDIYSLQFYLQIGYICSPDIVNLSYNKERIVEFDFPSTLEFINGLSSELLADPEEGSVLLELIGINLSVKKFIGYHITCINRIICSDIQIENLKYLFEGNSIPYQFIMVKWEDSIFNVKTKQLRISKIHRDLNKSKILDAWSCLKLKGGLSLLRALPLVIDKRVFTTDVLSKPYYFADDFVDYFTNRLKQDVFTEDYFVKLIQKYSKCLNKQYGLSAVEVINHINNPAHYDDLQTLFELTSNLKNSKSNFSVLEFAFIHRKYKKLNNSISRDMEKALGEVLLAWDNFKLPDCDLVRLVFQIGNVAGYASLYPMEAYSARGGQLIFAPNLDDLLGLGFEIDKLLEIEQPGLVVMPRQDGSTSPLAIDKIVDGVCFYQYEKLLRSILNNDVMHRKLAALKLILTKCDAIELEEFQSLLLKLAERCIEEEPPNFANKLIDNLKNNKPISDSDMSFLNLISNGFAGVVRMLP